MRITASQILQWVDAHSKEAQAYLPYLIGRLSFDPRLTNAINFPSDDSTCMPSWDGLLSSKEGNAWVPAGESRWEVGCDKGVTRKANSEYAKRTSKTLCEDRTICTFVFVTPRRWKGKQKWIAQKKRECEWADVKALDVDNLEQWLGHTPAVALQFAELLGLVGWGVASPRKQWELWARQSRPQITTNSFFAGRSSSRDELARTINEEGSEGKFGRIVAIRADSVEEGASFAVAVVMEATPLVDQALVVTGAEGWRYVEANKELRVVIASHTEVASEPVLREGLLIIVPFAAGTAPQQRQWEEFVLERPNIYEFEKALVDIGVDEAKARRHARNTGRSWAAFRRQQALNPALRRPGWLRTSESASLPLLCLLGGWDSSNQADRRAVEQLAMCAYEVFERDLKKIASLDDPPLLCIGTAWKVKSPLELLSHVGAEITSDQFDRFLSLALEVLSRPDPRLELPDKDRWMAQLYGKSLPWSPLFMESLCDALIKLAVRGPETQSLATLCPQERIAELVRKVFHQASSERWFSLSSYLPALAEAAPDEFLRAVETSLREDVAPVKSLLAEGSESTLTGRCWHAGLLWGLEVTAWNSLRLAKVTLILAELSHVPIKANWANNPTGSLVGLFRSWLPQTAATLNVRLEALDLLISRDAEVAFNILLHLSATGHQVAIPAARPKWREDDAKAGFTVTEAEFRQMVCGVRDRLLRISATHASRLASLLTKTILGEPHLLQEVLPLLEPFASEGADDADREILRQALREVLHRCHNFDDDDTPSSKQVLNFLEDIYDRLMPRDLVLRHRWLFENYWIDLPEKVDLKDHSLIGQRLQKLRTSALAEVRHTRGMACIDALIQESGDPRTVGATLACGSLDDVCWPEWVVAAGQEFDPSSGVSNCINGFFSALPSEQCGEVIRGVLEIGAACHWASSKYARVLALARPERTTWEFLEALGREVEETYWSTVKLFHWPGDKDLEYVLEHLLSVRRPRTALRCCQYALEDTPARLLFKALQGYLEGQEDDSRGPDSWHLAEMLRRLEEAQDIERNELIGLEFLLFPGLAHGRGASAQALLGAVISEPRLFAELISLAFKPSHGVIVPPTETSRRAAECAYQVLHACNRLPGMTPSGDLDGEEFRRFIDSARRLCSEVDRLGSCDRTIGSILANAPADAEGTWPIFVVREYLDSPEFEDLRQGFLLGALNSRGITSRSPWEGGKQERELVARYRQHAERMQATHPYVSATLLKIAEHYEHAGRREDDEASLTSESF